MGTALIIGLLALATLALLAAMAVWLLGKRHKAEPATAEPDEPELAKAGPAKALDVGEHNLLWAARRGRRLPTRRN
jgi:hypothetical protein